MSKGRDNAGPVTTGLAVIDKEPGMTSHTVVGRARRVLGQKKVGHAGTLDPDATGVLVLGLGRATRLLRYLTGASKTYEATISLGSETSTLDAAGEITATHTMSRPADDALAAAVAGLTGDIQQIPPMVSAIQVGGKRLHQLAREGIEIERKPRAVTVSRFDVRRTDDPLILAATIDVSSGTYIRSLAADLGTALGGGAHLATLRRTRVGEFGISEAHPVEELQVLPPHRAVPHLEHVTIDAATAVAVGFGKVLDADRLAPTGPGPWAVLAEDGELLAVYIDHGDGRVKPELVIAPAS